jgi:hypothetical protein
MAFEFTKKMEGLLDLFIAIHGRRPETSDEFVDWIKIHEANSRTTNSRSPLTDIFIANENNDSSF